MRPIEILNIEQLPGNIMTMLRNGKYTVYQVLQWVCERMTTAISWLQSTCNILNTNENERIAKEEERQAAEATREEWYDGVKENVQKGLYFEDGNLVVEVDKKKYALLDARRIFERNEGKIAINAGVSGFDTYRLFSNMPATFELSGFGKAKFSYMARLMGELDSIKANGIEVLQNFNHTLEGGYHFYEAKEDGNYTGVKIELDKKSY